MTYESHLATATAALRAAMAELQDEMRAYPTPVSGCDAQYNHLVGMRSAISAALVQIEAPAFVATPRTPFLGAGVESR